MPPAYTVTVPGPPVSVTPTRMSSLCAGLWQRCLDWRGWARSIVAIRATPRQVALGVALGSFIAFTPFIGLQMLLAALVATVVGASRKAAMLAVWISNPLTMGPIFAGTYQLGVVLLTPESVVAGHGRGAAAPVAIDPGAGITLATVIEAGWSVLLPLLVGGAAVGVIAAAVSYVLTQRGVRVFQARAARVNPPPRCPGP